MYLLSGVLLWALIMSFSRDIRLGAFKIVVLSIGVELTAGVIAYLFSSLGMVMVTILAIAGRYGLLYPVLTGYYGFSQKVTFKIMGLHFAGLLIIMVVLIGVLGVITMGGDS